MPRGFKDEDRYVAPEGNDFAKGNSGGGAPEGNLNASKHHLHTSPWDYRDNLDDEEEIESIEKTKASIIEKMPEEPTETEEKLAEHIAVRMHIAEVAEDYIGEEGITQTVETHNGDYEKKNPALTEYRRYCSNITQDLVKLGVV